MNVVVMAAFHDELAKVAGAKRVQRLYKVRHKSPEHMEAFERARDALERRTGRYSLPKKHRIDPDEGQFLGAEGRGFERKALKGAQIGAALGGAYFGTVFGDPLAGLMFSTLTGPMGGAIAGVKHSIDAARYQARKGKAKKLYMKRIGAPEALNAFDPLPAEQSIFKFRRDGARDTAARNVMSVASKAVRAGSPKDVPTEMLRRRQTATPTEMLRRNQERVTEINRKKNKARLNLEKTSGAKRLLRLRATAHKSDAHNRAYIRAWERYQQRMKRYGVPKHRRRAPKDATAVLGGTTAGGALGGVAAELLAPGLGTIGAFLGSSVGSNLGIAAAAARKARFKHQTERAARAYRQRVGAGASWRAPDQVAQHAVRAGSPKDIPTSLQRIQERS